VRALYSLDKVLRKGGDSAFWRISTRAGRPEDENLEAGSSGSESCARLDLSHFAHVRSYRLLDLWFPQGLQGDVPA
jgi:hypothetical protein